MIFLDLPPIEILESCLSVLGYNTPYELREFSKKNFTNLILEKLNDILIELAPFYPENNQYILPDMAAERIITVLKHLCSAHGFDMKSSERGKKNIIHYRILGPVPHQFVIKFT